MRCCECVQQADSRGCSGGTRAQLLCVQLVEPVLHVPEGAQQVKPRLAQVEPGVERVNILLALVDARLLLCGRR